MTAALEILSAGPFCTLQDAGRAGWLRFGVTPAGPMDWIGHRTANMLAGNAPGATAVEVGPRGITVAAAGAALRIGVAAAGFVLRRDGAEVPPVAAITLLPGERLAVMPGTSHLWAYLAVAGSVTLPAPMGSQSTHLRAGIGPLGGRALVAGDRVPVAPDGSGGADAMLAVDASLPGVIRFVPGPQRDAFTAAGFADFAAGRYRVDPRSDRMAFRLSGPAIAHAHGHDIVSDGIAAGAIQVPGTGQPLVLMADRQPTGGYPKIGTVIRADIPVLAQTRPGGWLRFHPVSVEEAVAALASATVAPASLRSACRPAGAAAAPVAAGGLGRGYVSGNPR